jgi:hypothetical protein
MKIYPYLYCNLIADVIIIYYGSYGSFGAEIREMLKEIFWKGKD